MEVHLRVGGAQTFAILPRRFGTNRTGT